MKPRNEPKILLYQTDDGTTRVEVRMVGETVWLNQNQMAELFLSTKQNIGQHIRTVFAKKVLAPASVAIHEHDRHHRGAGIMPPIHPEELLRRDWI